MEENNPVRRQVNVEEALQITGYTNPRSLQRAVEKGLLTVEKIPNPEKNNVKENYYFEDELKALKEQKTKSEVIKNPQLIQPGATTPDTSSQSLTPIVGNQQGREFLEQLLTPIAEALDAIKQTQQRLIPPPAENPEPTKKAFLTVEEAHSVFGLSKNYLNELWKKGEKISQHKGDHGKRLFSRKELENL
jgi:hypothetical protein